MKDKLDKWAAEQCKVYITETYWAPENRKSNSQGKWTLSDPRCMQVFREKFRFDTETFGSDLWECYSDKLVHFFEGKTIQEAELACAQAIMENYERQTSND